MTIQETINNVLHANENAEKAKREAKRARRNAAMGAGGIVTSAIASIALHYRWTNKIKALQDSKNADLMAKINALQGKIDALEGAASLNDQTIGGNDDN